MGISSSALASLVIAGTAIGGTTIAVIANTAQADLKSSNISQISTDTQTPVLPGDSVTPNTKPGKVAYLNSATPMPTPTPDSALPVITPPPFTAGDDESEGADDESDGSDDGNSDNGDYGDNEDGSDD
jgi:hypothetical protein